MQQQKQKYNNNNNNNQFDVLFQLLGPKVILQTTYPFFLIHFKWG